VPPREPGAARLRALVRDIPDFPVAGVTFKDITPVLADPYGLTDAVDAIVGDAPDCDLVAGIEARGFILGAPVARQLECGFVPVRKPGKLPWRTVRRDYDLEYGQDAVEAHEDAVLPGQRVLIVDDVLATGGTASAACGLVEAMGGIVVGVSVLIELAFLDGRAKLVGHHVQSVLHYE
jgi:adenine phosphoribosyltransferase